MRGCERDWKFAEVKGREYKQNARRVVAMGYELQCILDAMLKKKWS